MKFKILLVGSYRKKYEVDRLEKIGYKFDKIEGSENLYAPDFKSQDGKIEIDFENLKDLMQFIDTYGSIVITEFREITIL